VAGYRHIHGSLSNVGTGGVYWSSTVSGNYSRNLLFSSGDASMNASGRAFGFSVRCVKD
jgi:hypothetical protein